MSQEKSSFAQRLSRLPADKLARLVTGMQGEIDRLKQHQHAPVAVIGLACRMPGADNADEFWQLLHSGADGICEVPPDRWDVDTFYAPEGGRRRMNTRWGGFLNGIDRFDAELFRISRREAVSMDPQQRITLEVVWQALAQAGYKNDAVASSRTGVFLGQSTSDYRTRFLTGGLEAVDGHFVTGNFPSILSGRVSYVFGLQGPSLTVDTACSSSLVSLHLACQSLRLGECDMALSGGVNLMLEPDLTIAFSRAGMMSPDGCCKTFDAAANGYVRGEGCGILVLKRLDEAQRDDDMILAIVRGSAVNQDGLSNGLTAPNGPSQQRVVEEALNNAGLSAAEIDYVECHGTGTELGDPIEVRALGEVFGARPQDKDPLLLGSVKTNIGHLEAAAGVAGVIKVILALQHGEIPPHLHFKTPNPKIPWARLPFEVPMVSKAWPATEARKAGVSSFSFGGTNCHVILGEAPQATSTPNDPERPYHVLTLSARSQRALRNEALQAVKALSRDNAFHLGDVCWTANIQNTHFPWRLAVAGADQHDIVAELNAFVEDGITAAEAVDAEGNEPLIAFLFSGQGCQFPGMGRMLYDTEPVFAEVLNHCDEIARPLLDVPLLSVLYQEQYASLVHETMYTQPALFAFEYAVASLWRSWGIEPNAVLGHSIGEYVAACVAGVFSVEEGLRLVVERGRLMQSLPRGGAMAVLFSDETSAETAIAHYKDLSIACVNAPDETVISGAGDSLDAVLKVLGETCTGSSKLRVSHAFHSPLMTPILDAFAAKAADIRFNVPGITLISNLTGQPVDRAVTDPTYWVQHLRRTVRFADGVKALAELGIGAFLELGPNPVLLGTARRCLEQPDSRRLWLPSLRRGQNDWEPLLTSLGRLYAAGANIDWQGFDRPYRRRRRLWTSCPFDRQRFWKPHPQEGRARRIEGKAECSEPEQAEPAEPEDDRSVAEVLRTIFAHTLQVSPEQIPDHVSFLEMGADSIMLAEAVRAVETKFSVTIARQDLFRALATLKALTQYIEERTGSATTRKPENATIPTTAPTDTPKIKSGFEHEGARLDDRSRLHLENLVTRYVAHRGRSRLARERYGRVLADSRASAGFRPSLKKMVYPILGKRAQGAHVWDVDGNRYVDLTMGFGVQLFGHNPAFIVEAVEQQMRSGGFFLGPQSQTAGAVAELITKLTGTQRVAFCNTGTEAVMTALRLARTATGRSKFALFAGSYHGHLDSVLVQPSADRAGIPAALGVTPSAVADTLVLDYSDAEGSLQLIEKHAADLAAVLVEPVQSRRPALQPSAFLKSLRRLTRDKGIALIFDEVLLGFRVNIGGAQAWADVHADVVTYGKIIGGGFPIGVVAGDAAFLDGIDGGMWRFDDDSYPRSPTTFFAGTFNKNPMTMATAHAVLTHLDKAGPGLQEQLNSRTTKLVSDLNRFLESEAVGLHIDQFASMFRFRYSGNRDILFYHLIENGLYIWEGRTCFLSTAHEDDDLASVREAVKASVLEMRDGGFLDESVSTSSSLSRSIEAPLSPGQQALLTLSQLSGRSSSAYNQSLVIDFHGEINAHFLERALQTVVARHESLRTTFDAERMMQTVHGSMLITVERIEAMSNDTAAYWFEHAAKQPFDLSRGPLLRAALIPLGLRHSRLIILMHHLITDGWSMAVLLEELAIVYTSLHEKVPVQLDRPMSFRQLLAVQKGAKLDEDYWLARFEPPPPYLNLPLDRPRPPLQTYNGSQVVRRMDPQLIAALRRVNSRIGCTMYTSLLACYGLMLSQASRQSDLAVAIFVAEQPEIGAKHLTGYCIATLPFRLRLDDSASLDDVLRATQRDLFDAVAHRHYPFANLVQELGIIRDPKRPPLVNVAFNLDHLGQLPAFADLRVEAAANSHSSVRWDLNWNLIERPDVVILEAQYNMDLFDAETISRWVDNYTKLLQTLVDDPSKPLGSVLQRSADGALAILEQFNHTSAPCRSTATAIHQKIEQWSQTTPSAPAVHSVDGVLSYLQLDRAATRLAERLKSSGLSPGAPVAVLFERDSTMIIAMLAVFKAGGVFLPLDPEYPQTHHRFLLDNSGAALLLTNGELGAELSSDILQIDDHVSIATLQHGSGTPHSARAHLAYIIYTSGSTGRPKGVSISHAAAVSYIDAITARLGLERPADWAMVSSFAADLGYTAVFGALCTGGCLHILSRQQATDPNAFAAYMSARTVDCLKIVPAHFSALLALPEPAGLLPRRCLILGGDVCNWTLVDRVKSLAPSCRIINHYGPTETTIGATTFEVSFEPAARPEATVPIGRPLDHMRVYLLGPQYRPVDVGETGEIFIAGQALSDGYLNDPALTAQRFLPDPFAGGGARMYRSGDRGRYSADGTIEFLGRIDDAQIKIRGYRVETGEIESALRNHTKVQDAVVLAQSTDSPSRRLVAYVVADADVLRVDALREWIAQRLPAHMVPTAWVMLEKLPLTPNGKIDRRRLPLPEYQGSDHHTAWSDENAAALASIWAGVLRADNVGSQDNFFELGGDSILAIQVSARAREIGLRISPQQIFENPTIEALLAASQPIGAVNAEQGAVSGEVLLTPIQHWFFENPLQNPGHWCLSALLSVRHRLSTSVIESALAHIVDHHDALRLRFFREGKRWIQRNQREQGEIIVPVVDLSMKDDAAEMDAAINAIASEMQSRSNITGGPMLSAALLNRGSAQPPSLLICVHHLVMDMVSWRILLEDLDQTCRTLELGGSVVLPRKTTSFRKWSQVLASHASTLHDELPYWLDTVAEPIATFPADHINGPNNEASVETVTVEVDAALTRALLSELPAASNCQPLEVLVAALVQSISSFLTVGDVLLDLEGHGREQIADDLDVSRTVGWFTTHFPLRLSIESVDGPDRNLSAAKEAIRGIPNRGIGYGLLRYCRMVPELQQVAEPSVAFNYLGRLIGTDSEPALISVERFSVGQERDPNGLRRHLIMVEAYVAGEVLTVDWHFSRNRHRRTSVETIASKFAAALNELINHLQSSKQRSFALSDTEEISFTKEQFDDLLKEMTDTDD